MCPLTASCILCRKMVSVDMNSVQFYKPPTKAGWHQNRQPTTSNLHIPSPLRAEENPAILGTSQDLSRVLHSPKLVQSQNMRNPSQKHSHNLLNTQGLSLNSAKADREIAGMPNEGATTGWDNLIPLLCQESNDRPHCPCFHYPPETMCETDVLNKPAAGGTTGE